MTFRHLQQLGQLPAIFFVVSLSLPCCSAQQAALDLDGKIVNPLQSNSKQPVVLLFVREDCPISGRYAPTIQRICDEHQTDARFYLVFPDKSESAAGIRKYLSDFSHSIPALRDPNRALVKLARAQVTPEAAVFEGMEIKIESETFDPDSHFLFWKPGTVPYVEPEGMSLRLDKGTDLVLNVHLQPSGKPETIQPTIGLYLPTNPRRNFLCSCNCKTTAI